MCVCVYVAAGSTLAVACIITMSCLTASQPVKCACPPAPAVLCCAVLQVLNVLVAQSLGLLLGVMFMNAKTAQVRLTDGPLASVQKGAQQLSRRCVCADAVRECCKCAGQPK